MTHHHVDRFESAVQTLAGEGNVKKRLMRAFDEHLDAISEEELPGNVKNRFSKLKRRLTRVEPLNGEGSVCASVRKMSAREASRCAVSVVALYGEMLRGSEPASLSVADNADDEASAPPFLVKSVS